MPTKSNTVVFFSHPPKKRENELEKERKQGGERESGRKGKEEKELPRSIKINLWTNTSSRKRS
jgi:hypothetical protein